MSINTGLALFDDLPVSGGIQRSYFVDYHPISSLTGNGPIEFSIPSSNEEYIDCNDINILLQLKITKSDGTKLDAGLKVGFINSISSSLFSDVTLLLNDTQIEGGQQLYPYRSYILKLIQYSNASKKSHLGVTGWNTDLTGQLDSATANTGHIARAEATAESKVAEYYGPVNLDLFQQNRYLLSHVDMRLRFKRAEDTFVLLDSTTTAYKVEVVKAVLHVRRALVSPEVINGHATGLTSRNAKYPVNHVNLFSYTIAKGVVSDSKENIFPSQLPKFMAIAMVTNEAYNGSIQTNPFNFQNFNANRIALYLNSQPVMGRILEPDFKNDCYAHAYASTMIALAEFNHSDESNGITYKMFKEGFCIFAFDLTADNQIFAAHSHGLSTGNLRLDLSFGTALANIINVIILGIFDSELEITQTRDVITQYTN